MADDNQGRHDKRVQKWIKDTEAMTDSRMFNSSLLGYNIYNQMDPYTIVNLGNTMDFVKHLWTEYGRPQG